MMCEEIYNTIAVKVSGYKYSSMNYLDFDECRNAEILYDNDGLILLQDKSKIPAMVYFATDDFEEVIKRMTNLSGKLRLHFVPRIYVPQLKSLGFVEWGEYVDFWNTDLAKTAENFKNLDEIEYLSVDECEAASDVTKSCLLLSRGFEGDSPEWFKQWLDEGNHVIVRREGSRIVGVCCVTIYNGGTTLHVREIAVDPKNQGMGLGKKLMEQAISYGVGCGAIKGFLLADVLNENAIGLYEKYDFQMKDEEGEIQMVRM